MRLIEYTPAYRDSFVALNTDWISRLFVLEEADLHTFDELEDNLARGAKIFLCTDDEPSETTDSQAERQESDESGSRTACGCILLTPVEEGVYELEKFASTHRGAGRMLLDAVFEFARGQKLKKLVLVTNTNCEAAIHLYRVYGFREVPVDRTLYPYKRGNIAFEYVFPSQTVSADGK